jgi:hypothetical protein
VGLVTCRVRPAGVDPGAVDGVVVVGVVDGEELVDDGGTVPDPLSEGAAAGVAGGGDVFERDGLSGQFGADRPAQECLVMEHADLGEVPGL